MTTITISDSTNFEKTEFASMEELHDYIQHQLLKKELDLKHRQILDARLEDLENPLKTISLEELKSGIVRA